MFPENLPWLGGFLGRLRFKFRVRGLGFGG